MPEVSFSDLVLKRECGLLLAYLSFQQGQTEQIAVGLGVARSTLSEAELEVTDADVRLIEYLTQLWVPEAPAEPDGE